jgi:hypothetical protein
VSTVLQFSMCGIGMELKTPRMQKVTRTRVGQRTKATLQQIPLNNSATSAMQTAADMGRDRA